MPLPLTPILAARCGANIHEANARDPQEAKRVERYLSKAGDPLEDAGYHCAAMMG
jgi:hypothetical protein